MCSLAFENAWTFSSAPFLYYINGLILGLRNNTPRLFTPHQQEKKLRKRELLLLQSQLKVESLIYSLTLYN